MAAIEIFKPVGNLKSMEGVSVSMTADRLQAIAARYDPAVHEAPCVIGHPTHDAPAYGWVKGLSFADGGLMADCDQSPQLTDLVDKKLFKKVSASFYTPDAPNNPLPGDYYLRHIGFLGAMPPAVKGLRAVSFADKEEGVVTFGELPGYAGITLARILGGLRDLLIGKFGQDDADKAISSWDLENLRSMSQAADQANDSDDLSATPALGFAEPGNGAPTSKTAPSANPEKPPMKTPEQLQTELDASNKALAAMQTAEAKRLTDGRHAGHVSFADTMISQARWPAGGKDLLVAVLDHVATPAGDAGVVSFGEGAAARPLGEALQAQLLTMPASVSFGEHATNGQSADVMDPGVIAGKAVVYQREQAALGNVINTAQAVSHVSAN